MTAPATVDADIHIRLDAISKSYGGVQAARDVSFDIVRGTVHALVGENGAGKSTISKIIAGAVAPSGGRLIVDGHDTSFTSPRQALATGIAIIDQELAMVPGRSVLDNVFLGVESRRGGLLDLRAQRTRFDELIARTGFELDPNTRVRELRVAQQQQVEILRALARDANCIIMDEPTAALTVVEAERLFAIVDALRAQGTTIVYITHHLDEVLRIADTVTVMRDGRHVVTTPTHTQTKQSLIGHMLGRDVTLSFGDRASVDAATPPVLEVEALGRRGHFENVSLSVRPGEVVGIAGLIGSGRTEVLRAIAGIDRPDAGFVRLDGRAVRWSSPRQAIRSGVVLLPESRKDEGLMMVASIASNTVITNLAAVSRRGILRSRLEAEFVDRHMRDLDVRAESRRSRLSTLSGGNQQKVLFGKCLAAEPRVLLIDEPTRGVDVGAKQTIYELIARLASAGLAIIVVSSELEEVIGLADHVIVMHEGAVTAELTGESATPDRVLSAAFGTTEEAS